MLASCLCAMCTQIPQAHRSQSIQAALQCPLQVHISYLEIYNETGYDLLNPEREVQMLEDLPKVAIMEDEESNIHMRNLSIHRANNEEEALNLVRFLHVQQYIRKLACCS
jgi:hypothetical protein